MAAVENNKMFDLRKFLDLQDHTSMLLMDKSDVIKSKIKNIPFLNYWTSTELEVRVNETINADISKLLFDFYNVLKLIKKFKCKHTIFDLF